MSNGFWILKVHIKTHNLSKFQQTSVSNITCLKFELAYDCGFWKDSVEACWVPQWELYRSSIWIIKGT